MQVILSTPGQRPTLQGCSDEQQLSSRYCNDRVAGRGRGLARFYAPCGQKQFEDSVPDNTFRGLGALSVRGPHRGPRGFEALAGCYANGTVLRDADCDGG